MIIPDPRHAYNDTYSQKHAFALGYSSTAAQEAHEGQDRAHGDQEVADVSQLC